MPKKINPEIIQRCLHLQDQVFCVRDIAAKVRLSEAVVTEILGRRGAPSRERAGIYSSGRQHKRSPGQKLKSFVG